MRSPTATGSPSTGTASGSSTSRRAPSRTRARSTSGRWPARPTSTPCRPTTRPGCRARPPARSSRPHWLAVVSSPDGADKTWVTEQYDRYVRGNTVLAQPEDAGVVRIDEDSHRGIALALDGNARYARLDPYAGAQLNLAEAYRNVAVSGAKPLAVTNCLNFGSPEEPEVMWQFAEAVRGLADGCRELGLPVTGGNVSLYNQTGDVAINPTPVIGVLGVHEDVRRRVPGGWRADGRDGAAARRDAGPSSAARPGRASSTATSAGGRRRSTWPPSGRSASCWPRSAARAWSAPRTTSPTAGWRRRSPSRRCGTASARGCAWTATRSPRCSASPPPAPSSRPPTRPPCGPRPQRAGVPVTELGTTGGDALVVDGLLELPLAELRAAWTATLPALFGSARGRGRRRSGGHRPDELMPAPDPGRGAARRPRRRCGRGWPGRPSSRRGRCVGAAVKTTARWLAQQVPGRSVELRVPPHVAVQCVRGPAAHPRHAAERRRDRRRDLAAAGDRRADLGRRGGGGRGHRQRQPRRPERLPPLPPLRLGHRG